MPKVRSNKYPRLGSWFSQIADTIAPIINGGCGGGGVGGRIVVGKASRMVIIFSGKKGLDVIFSPVLTQMKEHLEKQDA